MLNLTILCSMTSVARHSLPNLTASHLRKWLFCLCVAFLLAACGVVETPLKLAGQTMGTTWHVTLIAPAGFFVDDIEPKIEDILEWTGKNGQEGM